MVSLALFDQAEPQPTAPTLDQLERVIEGGLQTFVDVGLALLEIRDRRLFQQQEHATFEDYCRRRWGWGETNAQNYITAAQVAKTVQNFERRPANLGQALALAPLKGNEEAIRDAWQDVVDEARTSERPVTAADVKQAVARRESKSHAVAHAERLAVVEAREPEPQEDEPYGRIVQQDALSYLRERKAGSADVCITSPPYWAKRRYLDGDSCELGQERDPAEYVERLCEIVNEIGRVLTPEGCLFLNLGDTLASQPGQYRGDPNRRRGISNQAILANGTAPADRAFDVEAEKTFCLIPESVVMRLVLDFGWRLASKIVWKKIGYAPENVFDRLTQAWEPVYVLTRAKHAYFQRAPEGVAERPNDVWEIPVGRGGEANGHLAPFPNELVRRAIAHACPPGPERVVLDPFAGSGTVLRVAEQEGRLFLGCDLMAEVV